MNASVFLSATNADYSVARAVYQFLTDRGLSCFFCDESLLRVGEEKYRATVDRALARAGRVVVVTSDAVRAESEWVKYAWQGFVSGTVTGGLRRSVVTVLSGGLDREELPVTLRRGQCVSFPSQLDALPRMLESGGAAPDKPAAPARTERRTRRFLALVTVCNVLILGAMIWLLQRNGFLTFSESPPPAGAGFVRGANDDRVAGRGRVREADEARPDRKSPGILSGQPADGVAAVASAAEPAATDGAPYSRPAILRAKSPDDKPPPGAALVYYLRDSGNTGFCFIPRGTFVMGSPLTEAGRGTAEAQHPVTISHDFWMARYECTQSMWESVMGRNPSSNRNNSRPLPVETVSWNEIAEGADCFLARMNSRKALPAGWRFALPTEAQWEYACRAGTTTPFSFGSVLDGSQANCDGFLPYGTTKPGFHAGRTTPVGSYPANPWGLEDMHGNVWEWCADAFVSEFPGGTDPLVTAGTGRVQRGGSWRFNAGLCRSASRQGVAADVGDDTLGFRLAVVRDE